MEENSEESPSRDLPEEEKTSPGGTAQPPNGAESAATAKGDAVLPKKRGRKPKDRSVPEFVSPSEVPEQVRSI